MESPASQDIPLPYVFFTKSNVPHDPLDRVPGQRKADSTSSGGDRLAGDVSGAGGDHSAAADSPDGPAVAVFEDHLAAASRSASGGGAIQDDLNQQLASAAGAAAATSAATSSGSSAQAAAAAAAAAAGATASSKGERPPIMTPDERAWNDRLIKSFRTERSLIDAIVLAPSGIVISTLGRRIEGRVKDMNPGNWIGCVCLLLMLANLLIMLMATFNGFMYIRIIKPLNMNFTRDFMNTVDGELTSKIDYSVTTQVSLFIINSQIAFYSDDSVDSYLGHLFNNSNVQHNWESLTNNIVFIVMELLLGRQTLLYSYTGKNTNVRSRRELKLQPEPRLDAAAVPHCFQDFNALRDVWSNLFYCWIIYMLAAVAQLYIAIAEVLFKRIDDFADPRDRRLSPEQMRARITIGLEGVAALQRVCFYSKLTLAMQALVMLLFHRVLIVIKNVEFNTRHMANQLEKAGMPTTDVGLCTRLVYYSTTCGTVQCLSFFCFHSLAKYYSTIAVAKVPKVKLVPSQDESYVS